MKKACLSWLGDHDLKSIDAGKPGGPVYALYSSAFGKSFDIIQLLCNYPRERAENYLRLTGMDKDSRVQVLVADLPDPTDYRRITETVTKVASDVSSGNPEGVEWHFHTSPGTSQMAAVWVLLGMTRYNATLYQSWQDPVTKEQKVKVAEVPFSIEAEFLPEKVRLTDKKMLDHWMEIPEFQAVIHASESMKALLTDTYKAAVRDVPVLILGETGTGKELFAKAIHAASARRAKPFEILNCAALPETLVEGMLFGWSKGAFTGASTENEGVFLKANGGMLFLDEVGDLTPAVQVKLLRAVETGEFNRVGDGKPLKADVRIIAATNRDLVAMMREEKYREDLFYRLSVAVIKLPPLRDRESDAVKLAEHFLRQVNADFSAQESAVQYVPRKFSAAARSFIRNYGWPGNVRELYYTVKRVCLWADGETVTPDDLQKAVVGASAPGETEIPFDDLHPVDLEDKLRQIRVRSIEKAMKLSGGVKKTAADMLGYENYQTMDYHLKNRKT